jgi:hypothetical protein
MRKTLISCFLGLLLSSRLHAQSIPAAHPAPLPPAYYIDSQRVTDLNKVYVDVQDIANISVVNGADPATMTNGKVYITLKTPFNSFLRLSDINRSQQRLKKKKVLYIIDNKVITDTTGIRIDPSYIVRTQTIRADSILYANMGGKNMKILMIETKCKRPDLKPGTIMLRGK